MHALKEAVSREDLLTPNEALGVIHTGVTFRRCMENPCGIQYYMFVKVLTEEDQIVLLDAESYLHCLHTQLQKNIYPITLFYPMHVVRRVAFHQIERKNVSPNSQWLATASADWPK